MIRTVLCIAVLGILGASCAPNLITTTRNVVRHLHQVCFTNQHGEYTCVDTTRPHCGSDTDCEALTSSL